MKLDFDKITGQVIMWDKGPSPLEGKNSIQIFGVLAMPSQLAREFIPHETWKHTVSGFYVPDLGLKLQISEHSGEMLPPPYDDPKRGYTPDRLFTSPVWRV